jgi:arsenite/tail-anchored protein-transporting ATPase
MRLEEDLKRAEIATRWWLINASLFQSRTTNKLLATKANNEVEWIQEVNEHTGGHFAIKGWVPDEIL